MAIRAAASKSMLNNADPAVIVKLAHHEAQLEGLGQRMAGVENTLTAINAKLDTAISSLARTDAMPRWDLQKLLQSATYGVALVGSFVASIVWITNASFSSSLDKVGLKVEMAADRSVSQYVDMKERVRASADEIDKRISNMRERLMNLEKYLMAQAHQKPGNLVEPQLYIPPDEGPPPRAHRYKDERNL